MKIGASDYDGTLFRQRTIAAEDVEGIRSWRAAGNKFGVVSGRDYGMLMPQLKHYGIESDYAVCNNGGIIFRADGTPLWQGRIPLHVLTEIVQ
jgi:hydroxymethylpyrimidine pyrophosphatase-like HAD family hydrolase